MGRDSSSDRAVHLGLELPEEIHGRLVDGWQMVAEKVDSQTSFTSRNGLDHTAIDLFGKFETEVYSAI